MRVLTLRDVKIQGRLTQGLVFCLHDLQGVVLAPGLETGAFAREGVNAIIPATAHAAPD